ncbi:ribosomal protection-like ABC-F family protein [Clostridium estertheticum]|uniref:ribosomal protection-like ABC-F family protein n=1 Tax=Clostridium estertheticum TaxID=238834 RepID=UPI001C7D2584|nr:ABC-F type ribosomal protection protein [Clostridium estertheticum]MBX4268944.1 ABC-F type ribosomal protection protein [Clostridium estertheticum]WLC80362.1 ABC-F type ribosomal protection protein [Clostridium estertheticum]
MLILQIRDIKKSFGDRLLFDIKNLKVDSEEKIGIVGLNGTGKTTLMDILSKTLVPDEGYVDIYGSYSYITQLDYSFNEKPLAQVASLFKVPINHSNFMSGGEKTRLKIANSLSGKTNIIFADEPTSNLDIEGIKLLEEKLLAHKGALVLISHDRFFLDKLCNKIIELEDGKIKIYNGNYSFYKKHKQLEMERQSVEYVRFIRDKRGLEEAIVDRKHHKDTMRKTPKRMGNSEARLHRLGNQKAEKNVDNAAKSLKSRLDKLEIKDKPLDIGMTKVDMQKTERLHSKILIKGSRLSKSFGSRKIFKNANFQIGNGWKVALIGNNGCGKSTLIRMIMDKDSNISSSSTLKIGYFNQDLSILDEEKSILENVIMESVYDETFVRILLARLLIRGEDIHKKINFLSGGERVKVSLAKIFASDINMLILDEPTNYLDIYSSEAIETALKEFNGTILFVSHDRKFISEVADHLMIINNNKIEAFSGGYNEYLRKQNEESQGFNQKDRRLIIEDKISEVLGKISMPSKKDNVELLDLKYKDLIKELKDIKNLD